MSWLGNVVWFQYAQKILDYQSQRFKLKKFENF